MSVSSFPTIRLVLVEPAGPLNVGSVARVMKNMGLHRLMLVNPQCDHLGAEARQMAVHAAEILETAQVAPTLTIGLSGCCKVVATTGRTQTPGLTRESPQTTLTWLLSAIAPRDPAPPEVALVFGPEDRGLNNAELNQAHRFLHIPTNPIYPSLNLAQAVGICCYELSQLISPLDNAEAPNPTAPRPLEQVPETIQTAPGWPTPAAIEDLEAFYEHFAALLLDIGYLHPHTADSRMEKFRRLLRRAMPSSEEVKMLRGIIRQMRWATKRP